MRLFHRHILTLTLSTVRQSEAQPQLVRQQLRGREALHRDQRRSEALSCELGVSRVVCRGPTRGCMSEQKNEVTEDTDTNLHQCVPVGVSAVIRV